jgi:hypothetical protein
LDQNCPDWVIIAPINGMCSAAEDGMKKKEYQTSSGQEEENFSKTWQIIF